MPKDAYLTFLMKKYVTALVLMLSFASCKDTWNEEDKQSFYQACMDDAKTWAGSDARAKTYCDCVFGKMEKKYPNENDALEHIDKLAKDSSLIGCKTEIMR